MIILLGASGYVGGAFRRELERRQLPFLALSRQSVDYTHFPTLIQYFRKHRPRFLINAAGYTGRPNVDACETARADTLCALSRTNGSNFLPDRLAHVDALRLPPNSRRAFRRAVFDSTRSRRSSCRYFRTASGCSAAHRSGRRLA
jgi:hypothetical protein